MTDYEKLTSLIKEIDVLVGHRVTSETPGFIAWKMSAARFLKKRFGQSSLEYGRFVKTVFSGGLNSSAATHTEKCKNCLVATKLIFQEYLDEISNDEENNDPMAQPRNLDYKKIFIVHGHDGELKQSVARIVEKQGIKAIILSEQANKGRTIIEKFEDYSDVSGAICLFTADDYGRAKADTADNTRARQNVVLETGYFMGKLGRGNVVVIAENGLELPSDMQGIVYTNRNNWQFDVLKELKAIGYTIDYNKID